MSYVVTIVRDKPIDQVELQAFAANSPAFEIENADGVCLLDWTNKATGERESFVLSDGSLDITSPSDAALAAA